MRCGVQAESHWPSCSVNASSNFSAPAVQRLYPTRALITSGTEFGGRPSSPSRAHTDPSNWELSLSLAVIGLVPGNSFKYVATYLNPANAYRSNEFQGVGVGFWSAGNPGNDPLNSVVLSSYNVFVSAVPEVSPVLGIPCAVALVAGTVGGWRRWKGRLAS